MKIANKRILDEKIDEQLKIKAMLETNSETARDVDSFVAHF